MMMMEEHLWAFSLLLILRHNDVGHYKEGVFVLKRKEKKQLFLILLHAENPRGPRTLRIQFLTCEGPL